MSSGWGVGRGVKKGWDRVGRGVGQSGTGRSPAAVRDSCLRSQSGERSVKAHSPPLWRQQIAIEPIAALTVGQYQLAPCRLAFEQVDQAHRGRISFIEKALAVEPGVVALAGGFQQAQYRSLLGTKAVP